MCSCYSITITENEDNGTRMAKGGSVFSVGEISNLKVKTKKVIIQGKFVLNV